MEFHIAIYKQTRFNVQEALNPHANKGGKAWKTLK